jgi:exopolyphosphatase / guanosine-5'-triphosphate,3'-diphosphate pyrophosphatase
VVIGCIDIGSNTTRLLVAEAAEGRLRELESQRVFTRLGRGLVEGGPIPAEKVAQTASVVAAQAAAARKAGAERLVAVATATIRDAPNRAVLARAVEDAGGVPLWILSGDEEARLSFLGATRTLESLSEGMIAVIDVGGGSTEIAIGEAGERPVWWRSFRVGSGLLADRHLASDPPSQAELDAARQAARDAMDPLEPPKADSAIAVGGTATSLRRLAGAELTEERLEEAVRTLASTTVAETAVRFKLDPERVRLLPAGILVLESVSRRLALPLEIARGGLREGVVLETLEAAQGD